MKKVFLATVLLLTACSFSSGPKPTPVNNDETRAVKAAKELYEKEKENIANLEKGPCLAQEIIPDWSADIAHQPRQAVDDDPANQCQAFREGKTHHFLELDPDGNFLRAL